MNRTAIAARRKTRGFTLVELCVSLGVCAILAGQAVPALTKMRQEQDLRAASEALAGDLRFARSEAARLSDSVHFRISGKGANACYILHTGVSKDCDCAGGRAVCQSARSTVIKAEWLPARSPLRLRSNAESMQFQYRQGLVTQTGSIDLSLDNGPGIRQVVAITGRIRSCSTGAKLAGLVTCG